MKRNKLLLVSGIIGSVYLVGLLLSYVIGMNSSNVFTVIGTFIWSLFIINHVILVCTAVVFNWVGFVRGMRWAVLTAGILYSVSLIFKIGNFLFVVPELVLCFVAFLGMKKANAEFDNWGRPGSDGWGQSEPDSWGQSGSDSWGQSGPDSWGQYE